MFTSAYLLEFMPTRCPIPMPCADECNITATELNRNMKIMYRFLSEFTGLPEETVEMECGALPGMAYICDAAISLRHSSRPCLQCNKAI